MLGTGDDGTVGGSQSVYARDAGAVLRRGTEVGGHGLRQPVFAGGLSGEAVRHERWRQDGGAADAAPLEPHGGAEPRGVAAGRTRPGAVRLGGLQDGHPR